MESLLTLIKDVGLPAAIVIVVLLLGSKYINNQIDKKQCVYTQEFSDMRTILIEIKTLFTSFIYQGKYKGKDDD